MSVMGTRCVRRECQELVDPTPPEGFRTDMCKVHGFRYAVTASPANLPVHDPHQTVDAEPYARWLLAVEDSRTLEYNGVRLTHVIQRTVATLTGCTPTTVSTIAHGGRPRIKPGTARKLDPWVLRVSPVQGNRQRVTTGGGLVKDAAVAGRLPDRAIIVDRRGVAWQRWGVSYHQAMPTSTAKRPVYPCRLLWLPPNENPQ